MKPFSGALLSSTNYFETNQQMTFKAHLPIILPPISIDKRQNFPFKLEFSWWAVCALWSPLTSPLSPLSEHSVHSSSAEMRRRWLRIQLTIWSSSQVWVISSADQTSDGQELKRWSACQTTLYNTYQLSKDAWECIKSLSIRSIICSTACFVQLIIRWSLFFSWPLADFQEEDSWSSSQKPADWAGW